MRDENVSDQTMPASGTILIVDDQPGPREVLKGLLKGYGYDLILASSGLEALETAADRVPDLILLDVMMPGMDGFEVCQKLRADTHLAEIPVIMVTALDDRDSRLRGIEAGADDFITKPFDTTELQTRVRTIIRLNRYRHLVQERAQRQQAETEVRRRNYELTLLNQVITAAASTVEVMDILRLACKSLADAFDMPQATAWLLTEGQSRFMDAIEHLTPLAAAEYARSNWVQGPEPNEGQEEIGYLADIMSEYLLDTQAPLSISEEPNDRRLFDLYDLMQAYELNSLLLVPILIDNRLAGIVELGSIDQRHFSRADLTLIQSIAMSISQAMNTALWYENLQMHAADLEDIVTRRTHELQGERDRTRAILESLGEAVVVTDVTGAIQQLNPAAVKLTGFTEQEVKGQDWRLWQRGQTGILSQGEAKKYPHDKILETVRTGRIWSGEVSCKRKDGTSYDAMITMTPLFDPAEPDQIIGFAGVQSDITPLKEAERIRTVHQERKKQQAALDRLRHTFLSTVNHEMRTPLTLIFQTIEMLEDADLLGELAERQLDALAALRRQAWTLGEMVEGLTRVAAFLSKQEEVRPVPAQLTPVFNEVLTLAEFKARSKDITIETNIDPDLPFLPLDVKQIEEALTQLVDNAIKFNHRGGSVEISAHLDDDNKILIAVSDTGVGIEEELMSRVWEVFEQGVDPLKRAQEGLGLGLALAHHIVEAHKGTIDLETTPGQGSTVTIILPGPEINP